MQTTLKAKVLIGSVLFLSLLVFSGAYSLYTLSQLNASMGELYKVNMSSLEKVLQADRDMYQAQVAERSVLVAGADQYEYWKKFHDDNIEQAKKRAGVVSEFTDKKISAAHGKFLADLQIWSKDSTELFVSVNNLALENRKELIDISLGKLEKSFVSTRDNLDSITEILVQGAEEKIREADAWFQLNLKIMIGFVVLGVVGALFSAVYLIKNLGIKITNISDSLLVSAQEISSHVGDLDRTSQTLASSVSEQNSSSHESVSAMEEMSGMVTQTVESVDRSLTSLSSMSKSIETGKKVVGSLLESMEKIYKSSEKIVDVERVIDQIDEKTSIINDIVFKTQLLAFNASIEAARAGQHGRGFSVVAEEVSNLASLSGQAALQIKELLQKSKSQVSSLVSETKSVTEEGKGVTDEVGHLFEQIYGEFDTINDNVGVVKHATGEQSLGINQTLQAMTDLNKATQQTNTISNELEAKSSDLSALHHRLEGLINQLLSIVTGKSQSKEQFNAVKHKKMEKNSIGKKKNAGPHFHEITADEFDEVA